MYAVVAVAPGELELNYTFLPTFVGMNALLKKEIEEALRPLIEGQPWSDETIEKAHELVLTFLEERFSALSGLRDYLDGLKFIRDTGA